MDRCCPTAAGRSETKYPPKRQRTEADLNVELLIKPRRGPKPKSIGKRKYKPLPNQGFYTCTREKKLKIVDWIANWNN
jgi:hypothetical protein